MKEILIALAILHAGDSASTVRALRAGAREGNPLLPQNPAANVLVSSAYMAGEMVLLHELNKTHPHAAMSVGVGLVGLKGFAIGWNVRIGNQQSSAR